MSKFIQWWQGNPERADAIRERRRDRYQNDPDFRQREIDRVKAYAAQHKCDPKARGRTHNKPKHVWINNQSVEMWSTGHTLKELGIGRSTLLTWERNNEIPRHRWIDDVGRNWWPAEFVMWLRPFVRDRHEGRINRQEFVSRVSQSWAVSRSQLPQVSNDERSADQAPSVEDSQGEGLR
jgi:hypothetical protein